MPQFSPEKGKLGHYPAGRSFLYPPTISGLNYQSASSYQTLTAGSYQVIFTFTGQNSAVINSNPISFSSGQVRTVVGLDDPAGGFTTAVLSDLN